MKRFILLSLLLIAASVARGQWVQTNGPEGGDVTSFAYDDTFIYAGTGGAGVFRSTDNGASWTPANNGMDPNTNVGTLQFMNGKLFAEAEAGTYVSTDQGATWRGSPYLLAGAFQFGKYLLKGIYRSTDSGLTWAEDSSIDSLSVYSFASMGPDLFAATTGGVLLSIDSGATWQTVNNGLPSLQAQRVFVDGRNLFVGVFAGGTFRSTDSGGSWMSANQGLPGNTNINLFSGQGSNIYIEANGGWIFLSTDSGNSWEAKESLRQQGVSALEFIHGKLFAGSVRGVLISTDSGANWSLSNHGLIASEITAMTQIGTCMFAGSNGIFRSTDAGENWIPASNGIPEFRINALTVLGTELFAATGDGVFDSKDSGTSWVRADSGLPMFPPDILALAAQDSLLYAGTSDSGVYSSSNDGVSWAPANGGITNVYVFGLADIGNDLFASLPNNQKGILARSTDNGLTWDYVASAFQYQQVYSLAELGSDFFAASPGPGVFKSTDSGLDWVTSGNGIPNDMLPYALLSTSENLFLAGAPYGVYSSNDDGNNWVYAGTGIPINMVLTTLLSDSTNLFVGTQGTGIWRRPLSDFGISAVVPQQTVTQSLTAYPNPFSHSITVQFTSPESGYAAITIVNQLGEEISNIFTGELAAGEHSFMWQKPVDMPSGMYGCVVRMNGQVKEIPILLTQ